MHRTPSDSPLAPAAGTPTAAPAASPPACDSCGRDADFEISQLWLCLDCYHIAGSTCAGVGSAQRSADPTC